MATTETLPIETIRAEVFEDYRQLIQDEMDIGRLNRMPYVLAITSLSAAHRTQLENLIAGKIVALNKNDFSRRETSSVAEVAQSAGIAGAHKTASDGRAGEFTQGASEASGAHNPVEVGATPAPATICRYCGGNHHTGNCAYATDHE